MTRRRASRTLTRVLVVPDERYTDAVATALVSGFRQRLGSGVEVRVERVDAIAPERSGKFRYIVSHATPADAAREPAMAEGLG